MGSFLHGLLLCASLIVAIGAQNAFVLRQGLERSHVLTIVLVCALSDALLSAVGISGAGVLLGSSPRFLTGMAWLGAAYLLWFGGTALRRAFKPAAALVPTVPQALARRSAVGVTLALTYLNPHVYLDTVLLVGSVGAQEVPAERLAFWLGTTTASFSWFFGLGYGARLLRPWLAKPRAWRVLDGVIGATMLLLAASLVA